MQYLLLIYGNESDWDTLSEGESGKMMQAFGEFTQSIVASGHYKGGNRLHPVSSATDAQLAQKARAAIEQGLKMLVKGP